MAVTGVTGILNKKLNDFCMSAALIVRIVFKNTRHPCHDASKSPVLGDYWCDAQLVWAAPFSLVTTPAKKTPPAHRGRKF